MNTAQVNQFDPAARIATLREEHTTLERRLKELKRNKRLMPSEEQEMRSIKRQKLSKKDEIARLSTLLSEE